MYNSDELFEYAQGTTACSILAIVGKIFIGHWKPLMTIAGIQMGTFVVAFIFLGLLTFGFAATYIVAVMSIIRNDTGNVGRYLLDYTVGAGASRLLFDQGYYYYENLGEDDMSIIFGTEFFVMIGVTYIIWMLALSLISSIFHGAFIHAITCIYIGNSPDVNESITSGRQKMMSVYKFQLLYLGAITGILIITIALPFAIEVPEFKNPELILLGVLIFLVAITVFASTMVSAIPSIVIEGKSSLAAFERSWKLCKSSICLILSCVFCFNVTQVLSLTIMGQVVFKYLPHLLAFFGHLLVYVAIGAITPM